MNIKRLLLLGIFAPGFLSSCLRTPSSTLRLEATEAASASAAPTTGDAGPTATPLGSDEETPADPHCPSPPPSPVPTAWQGVEPAAWTVVDEEGGNPTARFRAATLEERTRNGLPEGTFFLLTDAFEIPPSAPPRPSLSFDLPLTPTSATRITVDLRATEVGDTYAVTELAPGATVPTTRSFTPSFSTYWSALLAATPGAPPPNRRVRTVVDNLGGVVISAVEGSQTVALDGPRKQIQLQAGLEMPVAQALYVGQWTQPVGLVAENPCGHWILPQAGLGEEYEEGTCYEPKKPASAYNACTDDSLDDDLDGATNGADTTCAHHADYSCADHTHTHRNEGGRELALFGTGSFCMTHQENWWSVMHEMGTDASNLFAALPNEPHPPEVYWSVERYRLRMRSGHCWIFPESTIQEVRECEGSLSLNDCASYPPDVQAQCEEIYDASDCAPFPTYLYKESSGKPERYLQRAWTDVNITRHIPGGLPYPIEIAAVVTVNNLGIAGMAKHPGNQPPKSLQGAVVINGDQHVSTLVHEVLHTIGVAHDAAPNGLMNKTSGVAPVFGPAIEGGDQGVSNQTLFINGMTVHGYPRPNGFEYNP